MVLIYNIKVLSGTELKQSALAVAGANANPARKRLTDSTEHE